MRQMPWGVFKKMVIADNCAMAVNKIWSAYYDEYGLTLLIVAILFTFQINCDFSGYSDIAIGCARMFGFNLMRNFNFPYFSRSIPEFWRRWHISLTTWFRDYIYIPLGGSHCSKWKAIRNVFIVWAVSGLWHGANWTFVCWGLFHAICLVIYNLFGINTKYQQVVACGRILPSIKEFCQMVLTFSLVVVSWIIFRAEAISEAMNYLTTMLSNSFFDHSPSPNDMMAYKRLVMCVPLLIVEWLQRNKQHVLQFPNCRPFNWALVRYTLYFCILFSIVLLMGDVQTFIYFQF